MENKLEDVVVRIVTSNLGAILLEYAKGKGRMVRALNVGDITVALGYSQTESAYYIQFRFLIPAMARKVRGENQLEQILKRLMPSIKDTRLIDAGVSLPLDCKELKED